MSDLQPTTDWWLASDGKWYPPEAANLQPSTPMPTIPPPVVAPPAQQRVHVVKRVALTTWEGIWYVIMCIGFGAGYFAKVPAKKAMQDFGLVEMTGAEHFWYVVMCIWFGLGYFAKIPTAKALSELPQFAGQRQSNLTTLSPQ